MVVIHPGAVLAMVDLLPSVSSDSQPEVRKCKEEVCFLSEWVKGLTSRQEVPFSMSLGSQLHLCGLGEKSNVLYEK